MVHKLLVEVSMWYKICVSSLQTFICQSMKNELFRGYVGDIYTSDTSLRKVGWVVYPPDNAADNSERKWKTVCTTYIIYIFMQPGKEGGGPFNNLLSGGNTSTHSISHPNLSAFSWFLKGELFSDSVYVLKCEAILLPPSVLALLCHITGSFCEACLEYALGRSRVALCG